MRILVASGDSFGEVPDLPADLKSAIRSVEPGTPVYIDSCSRGLSARLVSFCWREGVPVALGDPSWPPGVAESEAAFLRAGLMVMGSIEGGSVPHWLSPPGVPARHEWTDGEREMSGTPGSESGAAFFVRTSGSTGEPKWVCLSRGAVMRNCAAFAEWHGLHRDDVHATGLPLHHVNAGIGSLVGCCDSGATLALGPANGVEFIKFCGAVGARTGNVVPRQVRHIIGYGPRMFLPRGLEWLLSAAAPLTSGDCRAWRSMHGETLHQGYGQAEAVNFTAIMPRLRGEDWRNAYETRHPPVGVPIRGMIVRVGDASQLEVSGPCLMSGYWRSGSSPVEGGWLKTGDVGAFVPVGGINAAAVNAIVLSGRMSESVKRGGETLSPVEVEAEWSRLLPVSAFDAVAVPVGDIFDGEGLGMHVPSGELPPTPGVAMKMVPARVMPSAMQSGLPLSVTSTGKLQRRRMGGRLVSATLPGSEYERLASHVTAAAMIVVASKATPRTPMSWRIMQAARRLVLFRGSGATPEAEAREAGGSSAAVATAFLLADNWSLVACGAEDGATLLRGRGLWRSLMFDAPMGHYATLAAEALRRLGALGSGPVLEVGAGVGNLSSLIAGACNGLLVRTDSFLGIMPERVGDGSAPTQRFRWDFDTDPPTQFVGNFAAAVGCNSVHCAQEKQLTLRFLRDTLMPGGVAVFAEGSPVTHAGEPWCLDWVFRAFPGWHDRGGFQSREQWMFDMEVAGFVGLGWGMMRAGHHDLGGVFWGFRPGNDSYGV